MMSLNSPRCPASPTQGGPQARLSSLLVGLPNPKSKQLTQPPRAHAQSQLPGLLPRSLGWREWVGPACAVDFRGAATNLFSTSGPLLAQQLSPEVDSGGTVGLQGLCACREGSIGSVVAWKDAGGRSDVYGDLSSAMGMSHELLLALSGCTGSTFTWNRRSGLQVVSGSERAS